MEQKSPTVWTSVTGNLKSAALFPQQRDGLIAQALQQLITSIPAVGTALIWPCQQRKVPWKVYYAGIRHGTMQRWLSAHLDLSFNELIEVLQRDPAGNLPNTLSPLLIPLHTPLSSLSGIWITWVAPSHLSLLSGAVADEIERVRRTLEAVLEVEEKEDLYFSDSSPLHDRELIEAVARGDVHALSAFLSMTRLIVKADFTFWARVYRDAVESVAHQGAKHSDFGFTVPYGHGVGGHIAAYGEALMGDYRHCAYRDSSVCDVIDNEQIQSGIALPIFYSNKLNIEREQDTRVAAVLYVTRRTNAHFSRAEHLLMRRLANQLEPLLPARTGPLSLTPGVEQLPDDKAAWYDIVLHANHVHTLETWASQFIKGTVIVTDHEGCPYVPANHEQLEQMEASRRNQPGTMQVLSLATPGVPLPGQIYLQPSISLPPPQWPNFFSDLVVACNLLISRMEHAQDQLDHQREQWLHTLLKGQPTQHIEQDGYRLGLPIEHGQLWVLAWSPEATPAVKPTRRRIIAESVVLGMLKSPLLFFDDHTAIILLEEQAVQSPAKVRDALLKYGNSAQPLWIVHGARYHSLHDLKLKLAHAIATAQKARHESYEEYLLDFYPFGLDSLLENPRMAEDLDVFASKLLMPLIEYDTTNGSNLTETFVLTQTLGSTQAAADHLAVHVNTIRYRLHRARDILRAEQASPKELTAMALAAFIWQRFHMTKEEHK